MKPLHTMATMKISDIEIIAMARTICLKPCRRINKMTDKISKLP